MNSQKSKGKRVFPLCLHSFPHPAFLLDAPAHTTPPPTHIIHTQYTHCTDTLCTHTAQIHIPHTLHTTHTLHSLHTTHHTPHIDTHMHTMPCTHHTHTAHTLYGSHVLHIHVQRRTHVATPHTYYTPPPASPSPALCTHIHPTHRVHFCAIILWMPQILFMFLPAASTLQTMQYVSSLERVLISFIIKFL